MSPEAKMQHCMGTALSGNILLNIYIIFMKRKKIQKITPQPFLSHISVAVSNPRGQGCYQICSHIESKTIAIVILVQIGSNV